MYTIFWHFQHRFLQVKCTWSGISQSSDSAVEELLILLLQPALCRADNVYSLKTAPTWWTWTWSNTWFIGSTPQTASWSVQPFLHGSRLWQTDRQTTLLLCNNRPHLHSSEIKPNNKMCYTLLTDSTNQLHNIYEIYNVHLHQSTNFLITPCTLPTK